METYTNSIYLKNTNNDFVEIPLCGDCRRHYFSPEGFLKFGKTFEDVLDLINEA